MDWASVAKILGEQGERPVVLLDRSGRVRLINREMEKAFGFGRSQVEGKVWSEIYVPLEHAVEALGMLDSAFTGALPRQDLVLHTKAGGQVRVVFALSVVGEGLLMCATQLTPIWQADPNAHCDRDYAISTVGAKFGALTWVCSAGSLVHTLERETRCYALLHGLSRPCTDCPVLREEGSWPRTHVRHHAGDAKLAVPSVFEVITVEELDMTAVRVRVRYIDEDVLAAIQNAKLDWLAVRAGLSKREREVLEHIMLGRGLDDIAQLVGISARTVKHHQASALRKLGADSRADLLRVVY